MYEWLFFLHLTSLALWLGGLVMVSVLLLMINRSAGEAVKAQISVYLKLTNRLLHPSALVVLLSGGVMIQQMGIERSMKPFWLLFMEQWGGMVVLLSTIVLGLVGRRLKKRLLAASGGDAAVRATLPFRAVMLVTVCGILTVLGVVSLKIT
ncbi:hypothetical protein CIG75_08605 [Tumebacillus algifaecis]|uniref:Copper resistance protein D domain-containing protein n=1 Tax=Tumebacillus algifaecis TaxID=1214604 RepID=A0A223CZX3_9BACL|nr:hypothetical protein [Tumebacillus algifaecis]ASS75039.1 hypothetical protein CIG75_08605 [Tumebacillus algifaecis]